MKKMKMGERVQGMARRIVVSRWFKGATVGMVGVSLWVLLWALFDPCPSSSSLFPLADALASLFLLFEILLRLAALGPSVSLPPSPFLPLPLPLPLSLSPSPSLLSPPASSLPLQTYMRSTSNRVDVGVAVIVIGFLLFGGNECSVEGTIERAGDALIRALRNLFQLVRFVLAFRKSSSSSSLSLSPSLSLSSPSLLPLFSPLTH